MKGTVLALLLVLVALGTAALWWSGEVTEPTPNAPGSTATRARTANASDATVERVEPTALEATADRELQRRDGPSATARPFPDGATWIELTVIDRTGSPLPGAEVGWFRTEDSWRFEAWQTDEVRILAWRQDAVLLASEIGWRTATDDDGKVRIAIDGSTTIAGRHQTLRGSMTLELGAPKPTGGHRLVLDDRDQILVQVLTHDDAPAADLPIGLFCALPEEDSFSYLGPGALAITDQQGRATIVGLGPHREELAQMSPDRRSRAVFLRPFQPGFSACAQRIDVSAPPEQPVVLRLPPCGSVRARVDVGTAGVTMPRAVTMHGSQEQDFDGWLTRPLDEHGFATFAHVPVDAKLFFEVPGWRDTEGEHAGPHAPGERVDVVLTAAPRMSLVRARLFDADGPIRERRLRFALQGEHSSYSQRIETDADGRFDAPIAVVDDSGVLDLGASKMWFSAEDESLGSVQLRATSLRVGINDLGDLHLELPNLLARGRIVVAGTRPEAPAERFPETSVSIERFSPQDSPDNPWQHHAQAKVDAATGTFELRGDATPARLRAKVHSFHLLPGDAVEFDSGAKDLVLEARRGFPLAASILLPDAARADMLTCRLVAKIASPATDDRLQAWPLHVQGQLHHLFWGALPAGSYKLTIAATGSVVTEIPDIVLPLPADGDPRLVDIDLRQLLRVVSLRVSGADSQQGEDAISFAVSVRDEASDNHAIDYGYRALELLLPRRPVQALVIAEGHRPHALRIDREDVEVKLDGWQKLTVRVADIPTDARDMTLHLQLLGPDTDQVLQRMQQLGFEDDPAMLSPTFSQWTFDGDTARVLIGDGPHRVQLSASRDDGWLELDAVSPAVIHPTTGVVTLRVPPTQWQQAIETLKPKPGK